MLREEFTPGSYTVAADHASIEPRTAGEHGTRYLVSLRGAIDDRWALAFRSLRIQEPETSRFQLDRYGRTVSFLCAEDDPRTVAANLGALDSLIAVINESAAAMGGRR
jgi:hypothetical protein